MLEVKLGNVYEDTVTGFKGTVTAYTKYISGTDDRVTLTMKVNKSGNVQDYHTDVSRLKSVTKEKVKKVVKK